ncbi:alpha/beta hydrolase [Oleomonas cavernae]|uniref:Alpha/beta hydrolase n=1 Tax=Oleomonas cavernae TaxID=2320859 RepID=A0A418W8F9_9PROT|nr:alpha/beta hydrolase [Oleomonas cavernae]RJF86293.1 alpha/beta hydrolase [Oleomonas cavernae]
MRRDIEFKTEDGITLRGWLYPAQGVTGPAPTVVMAHGFSAVKEMYLDDFAAHFAANGLACLVYDHRNLGASDGTPRGHIDPQGQISGYRDAITFAGSLVEVDAGRIGIWGSSYSGGHVLVVAAIDRRVKCVVSQVPLVAGLENARRLIRADHWVGLRGNFDADRQARYAGDPPGRIPVTAPEGEPCALPTADTWAFFQGYRAQHPVTTWVNEVTVHSIELFTEYEPGAYIPRISPTPLLMVVARDDHLTPADMTTAAYETAHEPKQVLILPCGHFDAYTGAMFEMSAPVQTAWFKRWL